MKFQSMCNFLLPVSLQVLITRLIQWWLAHCSLVPCSCWKRQLFVNGCFSTKSILPEKKWCCSPLEWLLDKAEGTYLALNSCRWCTHLEVRVGLGESSSDGDRWRQHCLSLCFKLCYYMEKKLNWARTTVILLFSGLDMHVLVSTSMHTSIFILNNQWVQAHKHSLKQESKSRDFLSQVDEQTLNILCPQIHKNSI